MLTSYRVPGVEHVFYEQETVSQLSVALTFMIVIGCSCVSRLLISLYQLVINLLLQYLPHLGYSKRVHLMNTMGNCLHFLFFFVVGLLMTVCTGNGLEY